MTETFWMNNCGRIGGVDEFGEHFLQNRPPQMYEEWREGRKPPEYFPSFWKGTDYDCPVTNKVCDRGCRFTCKRW